MPGKRQKFDMTAPGAQSLAAEIRREPFLKEGTMVAFPACFPGVTLPLPSDESRITALDIDANGIIHGGSSGRRAHLLAGIFHGVSGVVFDMGSVEGADACAAVCCGKTKVVACVNGPAGGRVVMTSLQPMPDDLLQEWGIDRIAIDDLGEAVRGEPILHAVADQTKERVVGITPGHLFTVDVENAKVAVVGEIDGIGRIALSSRGNVIGRDGNGHLWRYDPRTALINRRAIELPPGEWTGIGLRWARGRAGGIVYTADGRGTLFAFDEGSGFGPPVGRTMVAPVGPMAVTSDGCVFGFCGEGISRMFCYDPRHKQIRDLGIAVSVIERRRYGYTFGDAVTGRDGQIFFGENDDLGHLWIHFPGIQGA